MNYSTLSTDFLKQILRTSNLKHTPDLPTQRPLSEIKAEIEGILRERDKGLPFIT